MKKIMFNDKYGLTAAVLSGYKTMTRLFFFANIHEYNVIRQSLLDVEENQNENRRAIIKKYSRYQVGEIVAVAQSYFDLRNCEAFYEALNKADPYFPLECIKGEKGAYNKMFVKAEWMPYRIRITDIKVELLQDISDEDCIREGIGKNSDIMNYSSPREAFAALIDKVSGNGTWGRNPWVFAYTFELERRARP